MGLARFKDRVQRPLLSAGVVSENWGHSDVCGNHHKCPLNLRFSPQTTVTLKEGVLTQDPWIWILSPSYMVLHAK